MMPWAIHPERGMVRLVIIYRRANQGLSSFRGFWRGANMST